MNDDLKAIAAALGEIALLTVCLVGLFSIDDGGATYTVYAMTSENYR